MCRKFGIIFSPHFFPFLNCPPSSFEKNVLFGCLSSPIFSRICILSSHQDDNYGHAHRHPFSTPTVEATPIFASVAQLTTAQAGGSVGVAWVADPERLAARVESHAVFGRRSVGTVDLGANPLLHLRHGSAGFARIVLRILPIPLETVFGSCIVAVADVTSGKEEEEKKELRKMSE